MADEPTPMLAERLPDTKALGALAHRMNNAVSYVVTNLHLVAEALEELDIDHDTRERVLRIVADANEGTTRVGELIRQLRVLSWGSQPYDPDTETDSEDTWDDGERGAQILVIDDEPHILTAVTRALKRYQCMVVQDGKKALELLEDGRTFDLILCDLIMREVSGIELYRWMEKERPRLLPRLVFITAGAFTAELRDFLSRVPNTVLHKPFDVKTLRWMVAQKLRGL